MSNSTRPVVKRTYGSRKATTSSSPAVRSSCASTSSSSPLKSLDNLHHLSSDSPFSSSQTSENDDINALKHGKGKGKACDGIFSSTPPTSPPPSASSRTTRSGSNFEGKKESVGGEAKTTAKKGGDLRSFFTRCSPRKKRKVSLSDDEGEERKVSTSMVRQDSTESTHPTSTVSNPSSSSKTRSSTINTKKPKAVKLEQLYLDPFDTPGRATLSCATCSLSYARTPEDINFHTKHHKKIVSGIDWNVAIGESTTGVTVVDDGIEWEGKTKGSVLMVDWTTADASIKRRLGDVLETIDTELSSTSLTQSQLSESKLFLFVTPNRKVVACAVVQRIKEAFQIVPSSKEDEGVDETVDTSDLLRFGEDSGAIFCSPTPSPTILGVHRIWTSTSSRRQGLASLLLDHMAQRHIYGCPIEVERRKDDVAFSQPTGKGKELAMRWTGTGQFKVFVD